MKFFYALALIGGVFCCIPSFSQDVDQGKNQSKIDTKLPKYQVTGNELKDIASYNFAVVNYYADNYAFPTQALNQADISQEAKNSLIRDWNKNHPDLALELKIESYKDYQTIVFTNQLYNYPPRPVFVDTGDARQDAYNHKVAIKAWSESHPDYPKFIDTGDAQKDANIFRLAHLAFYDQYLKN